MNGEKQTYGEADSPLRFMSLETAREISKRWAKDWTEDRTKESVVPWLPAFSAGKGGRFWVDARVNLRSLEAIYTIGRSEVPESDAGSQWWRMPEAYYTDDNFVHPEPCHEAMTVAQALSVLEEKRNGNCEVVPADSEALIEFGGETTLEEVEAIITIWRSKLQTSPSLGFAATIFCQPQNKRQVYKGWLRTPLVGANFEKGFLDG